jgi:hypothetical protein
MLRARLPRAAILQPLATCALAATLGALGCGPPPPTTRAPERVAPPKPKSLAESVADELDPGPPAAFWPTLPADVRADLERTAAAPPDPARRVAAARERLETWALDFDASRPDAHRARIRAGLEGLYLAEPLALAKEPTAESLAAAALLVRFYAVIENVPRYVEWLREMAKSVGGDYAEQLKLAADTKPLENLATVAPAMHKHLSAKVLRAGKPKEAADSVLRDFAGVRYGAGDVKRARDLYVEYIKSRGADATADDWLTVAAAHVRVEDRPEASLATERARVLAAKRPDDRPLRAKLRAADADLRNLDRLRELAKSSGLDADIERADLLRSLRRSDEAAELVARLKKDHPKDARVRVRQGMVTFEKMATAGKLLEGAIYASDELKDPNLQNKDGDYWSMMLGAAGVRTMSEVLPELARNPEAGVQKMVGVLKAIRDLADQLAKSQPGRAAAIAFLVDRTLPLMDKMRTGDVGPILAALQASLPEALALRAKYPETADVDRLVLTGATFAPDRAKAFEAVAARPKTAPEDDPPLYLQRARTAVTLAAVIATPAVIASTRAIVNDVPATDESFTEAVREALLGDVDVLEAIVQKDAGAWARAVAHYEIARKGHKEVRARLANNLGFIALAQGDQARAEDLFLESARDQSPRRWLAFLNALLSPNRAGERLTGLRDLAKANRGDGRPPVVISTWLASVATDPAESSRAAKEAVDELATPLYAMKPDASAIGLESEGSFQIGLGLASKRRYHEIGSYAYGSLWLMPPPPMSRADLEAKARGGAADPKRPDPKKPDPKKPEPKKAEPKPKK